MNPQAYGVGLAKTGSTSLARGFALVGSTHEESHYRLEPLGVARLRGEIDDVTFWRLAGARLSLPEVTMDVCSSHHLYADLLADRFPAARFVWTIREVRAWSNSLLDMEVREASLAEACGLGSLSWEMRFPRHAYSEGVAFDMRSDSALLPELIRLWSEHMLRMRAHIPPERLFAVRIHELGERLDEIFDFVGAGSSRRIPISRPANSRPPGLTFDRWLHSHHWHEAYLTHAAEIMCELFPQEHVEMLKLMKKSVDSSDVESQWLDYVQRTRSTLAFATQQKMSDYAAMLQDSARTTREISHAIATHRHYPDLSG